MQRLLKLNMVLALTISLFTGCATTKYPRTLTAESATGVKRVSIVREIVTPSAVFTPMNGGGVLGMALQASQMKRFAAAVREKFDFQQFAEDTLRESFSKAIGQHAGWTLVTPADTGTADAAFLLEVTSMSIFPPPPFSVSFKPKNSPGVTISATLISNPPLEVVRTEKGEVQILDPEHHQILYKRVESITNGDKLPAHDYGEYRDNPEIFKEAFKQAIDLAVTKIAASWNAQPGAK